MKTFLVLSIITISINTLASDIYIQTKSGYKIRGFGESTFNNPNFNRVAKEGSGEYFKGTQSDDELTIYKYKEDNADIQHITHKDTRFDGSYITSVLTINGKISSQLNCDQQQKDTRIKDCFAITKELCDSVLKESGKKNFAEFATETQKCVDYLNVYNRAIGQPGVQNSIFVAYSLHAEKIRNEDTVKDKIQKTKIKVQKQRN